MKVAIVGGGSSGLAAAKACIEVIKINVPLHRIALCSYTASAVAQQQCTAVCSRSSSKTLLNAYYSWNYYIPV